MRNCLIIIMSLLFVFSIKVYYINGDSLGSLLPNKSVVIALQKNYLTQFIFEINRGDIVFFNYHNGDESKQLVKIIKGVSGERVRIDYCNDYVKFSVNCNNREEVIVVYDNATNQSLFSICESDYGVEVLKLYTLVNEVFVYGTGEESTDSREIGPVNYNHINAKLLFRLK